MCPYWRWMNTFTRCQQSWAWWTSHLSSTYLNNKRFLFSTDRHDPEEDVKIACFPTEPREPRLSPPGSHPRHDRPRIPPTVRRWFPGLCPVSLEFQKRTRLLYSRIRCAPKSSLKCAMPSLRFVRMMLRFWCSRASAAPSALTSPRARTVSCGARMERERESARLKYFDSMHGARGACSFSASVVACAQMW